MPELVELRRKSGQRGLLITGYKRLKKDSDRAITPAMEAVCVPAHLALPGSPQAKQLHHLHTQLSLGQSCRREKTLVSMCTGLLWSCPTLCDPVDCGSARLLSQGDSPGKNTGVYWPYWLTYPGGTIFPAALAANSPEYLVLTESLQPKQLHHLHTWPSQGQAQVLQGSLRSKPQWTTHMQRWKYNHN